jgi:hypothetical protein
MERIGVYNWSEIRKLILRDYLIPVKADIDEIRERFQLITSGIGNLKKRIEVLTSSVEILSMLCFGLNDDDQDIVLQSLTKKDLTN